MTNLKHKFGKEIIQKLQERLGIKNPMAVPRVVKIMVNTSMKDFLSDKKNIEKSREELGL
ncbi:MAG: 50S ribosomal protein L5, partial [Candidatus Levybacteria bacterium RIFCSPLOWO2_01_FULL_38_120]